MTQIVTPAGFAEDPWAGTQVPPLEDYSRGPTVLLPVGMDPEDLAENLDTLRLIVIPFDSSADGRGFSLAAQLRALGYQGHIRAKGHILVDQFRAALRSGVNDIEITADQARRNPEPQWTGVPITPGYRSHLLST